MSTNSNEEVERKATEDESHIVHINASNTEITENTNTNNGDEKENKKFNSGAEIVVKIDENLQGDLKRNINDPDFITYGYHGQNQPLPTTWVYYQTGRALPDDGSVPLDYTPDRNGFVRLVFLIVFAMIAVTAGLNIVVLLSEDLSDFFKEYGLFLAIGAMALMIGLNYAMACSPCTRVMPCNIICLVLAVIGMSILCCYVTVRYDTRIVMLAVVATAGVVLVCLGLACTSFDFTKWLLYVIVIAAAFGLVTLVVSLYMLISGHYIKILHLVMLCGGTVISVIILTIELQMILGGKAVELSEDDYALGAFLLYTSIIDIFLKLVQIMGMVDDW